MRNIRVCVPPAKRNIYIKNKDTAVYLIKENAVYIVRENVPPHTAYLVKENVPPTVTQLYGGARK